MVRVSLDDGTEAFFRSLPRFTSLGAASEFMDLF